MSKYHINAVWLAPRVVSILLAAPSCASAALGGSPMPPPAGATVAELAPPLARLFAPAITAGAASTPGQGAPLYTIRQTTLASGTLVREYVSQSGLVVAVAWNGSRVPNLSVLLGNFFAPYLAGLKGQDTVRGAHHPATFQNAGLVVQSSGHMGSFFGRAWLPPALPAGLSSDEIR
jgi:hypothetical protein